MIEALKQHLDLKFSIFSSLIYLVLVGSLFYLKKDWKGIVKGVLLGALSIGISYFLVEWVFSLF